MFFPTYKNSACASNAALPPRYKISLKSHFFQDDFYRYIKSTTIFMWLHKNTRYSATILVNFSVFTCCLYHHNRYDRPCFILRGLRTASSDTSSKRAANGIISFSSYFARQIFFNFILSVSIKYQPIFRVTFFIDLDILIDSCGFQTANFNFSNKRKSQN